MFNQRRIQFALLSSLAVLGLLLTSVAAAGINGGRTTTSPPAGASGPSATLASAPAGAPGPAALPCNLLTPFNANNFPSSPSLNNTWLPVAPGTLLVMDGRINA